jgi:hypothetical protein
MSGHTTMNEKGTQINADAADFYRSICVNHENLRPIY